MEKKESCADHICVPNLQATSNPSNCFRSHAHTHTAALSYVFNLCVMLLSVPVRKPNYIFFCFILPSNTHTRARPDIRHVDAKVAMYVCVILNIFIELNHHPARWYVVPTLRLSLPVVPDCNIGISNAHTFAQKEKQSTRATNCNKKSPSVRCAHCGNCGGAGVLCSTLFGIGEAEPDDDAP